MLIDSHCHLDLLNLDKYQGNLAALVDAAKASGVDHILNVGIDLISAEKVIATAKQFDMVSASVGLHPSEKVEKEPTMNDIITLASDNKVIAIGETGLDYHYNTDNLEAMRERFRTHIRVARELKRPLIIHTRDAREDTINILREEKANEIGGVMHCFTENYEMAAQAMDLGFYISFSGIVTFKNAKNVIEVATQVPLTSMLIETDAPYLTPIPFRGKPNEPQFVRHTAEKIAELHNTTFEKVAEITSENFWKLFQLRMTFKN
jgi:TatD DNase family protein